MRCCRSNDTPDFSFPPSSLPSRRHSFSSFPRQIKSAGLISTLRRSHELRMAVRVACLDGRVGGCDGWWRALANGHPPSARPFGFRHPTTAGGRRRPSLRPPYHASVRSRPGGWVCSKIMRESKSFFFLLYEPTFMINTKPNL